MWHQVDLGFIFGRDLQASFVVGSVQAGAATEAVLCFRGADELQHGLVTDQRLSSPVLADDTEPPMLHRIPLGGAWRKVRHRDDQLKLIGQRLQTPFPPPTPRTVRAAIISFNQQFILTGIPAAPDRHPPRPDGGHRELGRFMGGADHHQTLVGAQIVDPIGDRFAPSMGKSSSSTARTSRRHVRPGFLKLPINSFFFVSTLMTGFPALRNARRWPRM